MAQCPFRMVEGRRLARQRHRLECHVRRVSRATAKGGRSKKGRHQSEERYRPLGTRKGTTLSQPRQCCHKAITLYLQEFPLTNLTELENFGWILFNGRLFAELHPALFVFHACLGSA